MIVMEIYTGEISKGPRKEVKAWMKRMKGAFKNEKLTFKRLSNKQYEKLTEAYRD